MATLYILCGPAGCGKSTWAKNFIQEHKKVQYVSRDAIRFEMVADRKNYFGCEKEVFKRFINYLVQALSDGIDIIADATHLSEFSRRKLTQTIDMRFQNYNIIYVVFNTDADTCIARNSNREGLARVPDNIIRNMSRDFHPPVLDEDERAIEIIEVN